MAMPTVDPHSDEIVLTYVEGSVPPADVPARDLHGGDVARIAYTRALQDAADDLREAVSRRQEGDPEVAFVRPSATPERSRAVVQSLVESGAFERTTVANAAPEVRATQPDKTPANLPAQE